MNGETDAVLFIDGPPKDLLAQGELIGYQDFNDLAAGWASNKETRLFHKVLEYFGQSDPELIELVEQITNNAQSNTASSDRNPVSRQLYIRTQSLFELVETLSSGRKVPGIGPKSLLSLKDVLGIDDPNIEPRMSVDSYYSSLGKFVWRALDNIFEENRATKGTI